ncbi:enolase-like domain-containing protein [Loigolactobacillus jiayinensis]|uniref:Mandelate racemase/muconate lactonizing enzyme N-terminal domain-containing protein n=1 Tax=Loigolactobacillus jiayinensis TaxID=2486016 RepID=A0ABW1RE85_9LACO|nr:hypothetical protein [Loigolactobacillus jiayinensis]
MTEIKRITTKKISLPLKTPFKTAKHTVTSADAILIGIETNNNVGYGAATPNLVVTGDTLFSIDNIITTVLAPRLIGQSLSDWHYIDSIIQKTVQYNSSAKAGLEIAFHNLLANELSLPLVTILGGKRQPVVTDYTVSISSAEKNGD